MNILNKPTKINDNFFEFWYENDKKKLCISQLKLIQLLKMNGFYRYEFSKEQYYFIRVQNNIAEQIDKVKIVDFVEDYIEQNIQQIDSSIAFAIQEKLLKGINSFFSDAALMRLRSAKGITFNKDTEHKSFIYFTDNYVEITARDIKVKSYKDLNGFILKSQILKRKFSVLNWAEKEGDKYKNNVVQFFKNISGDSERLYSLMSLIGYCLHKNFEGKRKAIILTDSRIDDNGGSNGRSGKSLICKMIGWILNSEKQNKNYIEIGGKSFKNENKHRFGKCSQNTTLVCLNDVEQKAPFNFKIDFLFNAITEEIEVDKKNGQPFDIEAKIIITTNKTLNIVDGSQKDRVIEFELTEHYSSDFEPYDDFKEWFGKDWSITDWKVFDSFMIDCVRSYLKNGIIEPKTINLNVRKLIDETNTEFYEFSKNSLKVGVDYNKKDLYDSFIKQYEYYESKKWFNRKHFLKWLRAYARCKGYKTDEWSTNSNIDRHIKFIDNG